MIIAKKSLGQNFLASEGALGDIVASAALSAEDVVLEAGPGEGALTAKLLEKAGRVIAVEKDDRLIGILGERFASQIAAGRMELIHGDILGFNPATHGLDEGGYKIVANIPYYITGQFLRTFLEERAQPSSMTLMVQKEVAERIVATRGEGAGKESLLSIAVKAYGAPRYVRTVPRGAFRPAPNVDSAVITIGAISRSFFAADRAASREAIDEKAFFAFVKKGFAHKRKLLAANLGIELSQRARVFTAAGVGERARAEELSIEEWRSLYRELLRAGADDIDPAAGSIFGL